MLRQLTYTSIYMNQGTKLIRFIFISLGGSAKHWDACCLTSAESWLKL